MSQGQAGPDDPSGIGFGRAPGGAEVRETVLSEQPFSRLVRVGRAHGAGAAGPRVLLVAPLSGMRQVLLYDMVTGLLPDHDVHVLVWPDAADVPLRDGPFGLDDNIAHVATALRRLGPGTHAIGLCQSALPVLAAAALLAGAAEPGPASLSLLGGKLDPRVRPSRTDRLARLWPLDWFERTLIAEAPPGRAGQGRRIYPAGFEWLMLSTYMWRHVMTGGELLRKVLHDDGADPVGHPFTGFFVELANVPGEFFLDTIARVFRDAELARSRLVCRGRPVEPGRITAAALLTVEAEEDDISPPGQTEVAHELCSGIAAPARAHLRCPGIGHFGLFHGASWREQVLPRLRSFIHDTACGRDQG